MNYPDLQHTARINVMLKYLVETLRARRDVFEERKSREYGYSLFDGNLKPATRD